MGFGAWGMQVLGVCMWCIGFGVCRRYEGMEVQGMGYYTNLKPWVRGTIIMIFCVWWSPLVELVGYEYAGLRGFAYPSN